MHIDARLAELTEKRLHWEKQQRWSATLREEALRLRISADQEQRRGAPEAAAKLREMAAQCERDADEWELEQQ